MGVLCTDKISSSNDAKTLAVKTESLYVRDMLSHSHVIEAFGGVRRFAEAISVPPARAIHWPRRGIPSKYWPAVELAARSREKPIPVTAEALMGMPANSREAA